MSAATGAIPGAALQRLSPKATGTLRVRSVNDRALIALDGGVVEVEIRGDARWGGETFPTTGQRFLAAN